MTTPSDMMSVSLKSWFQAHGIPILQVKVEKWDYDRSLAIAIECVDGWSVVNRVLQKPGKHTSNFDAIAEAAEAILAIWKNEHRAQQAPAVLQGNTWADIGVAWSKWKELDGLSV